MNFPLFSAHIGYLYNEHALIDRIDAARQDGFTAVEHPNPLVIDPTLMLAQLKNYGMSFAQMGAAGGDAARGEKGLAALPGCESDFRDALRRALDYAEIIGCPFVHPMAGVVAEGDSTRAEETYRTNLAYAVQECRGRSTTILVEAISEAAVPGYFLSTLAKALAIADEIAPSEIWFLADTYHAAASGTDLDAFITAHANRIGHIHIADFPGRHEPGTGDFDFEPLLKRLVSSNYSKAIGFEYIPSTVTDGTLAWMSSWKERLRA